jgi:hypothetical protein
MKAECPNREDANAFAANELSPSEYATFSRHLEDCAACRAELESTRRLVSRLRAVPEIDSVPDLAPLILAQVRERPRTSLTPARWWRGAGIAALLMLLAGVAVVTHFRNTSKTAAVVTAESAAGVARALDWFCQNQERDGSWNAEKWGGNRRFEVALTALPALALLSAETPTPQSSSAIAGATRWLQEQQTDKGSFGPDFQGAAYNESIATLALLQAYRRQPNPSLKRSLDSALANLLVRQTTDGGWGYSHSPLADRSITEWHIEALSLAAALGWENTRTPLERGRTWLGAHPKSRSDAEEPADSPSALFTQGENAGNSASTNMDFYRAYFLSAALRQEHDASSRQRLAAIRLTLLRRQAADGSESGSWPADDRWSRAGGRLYSTALAALSLRDR